MLYFVNLLDAWIHGMTTKRLFDIVCSEPLSGATEKMMWKDHTGLPNENMNTMGHLAIA